MCGIAGFYGKDPAKAALLSNMLKHRGPDDENVFESDLITLVHRRLAILDISGGVQPMTKNSLTIVFNGEIYNHLELRSENGENRDFKTRSDTETLLYLYEKYGEKMLEKLDGMFAFAIYDNRDRSLFLARDRFGKKPLYFTFQNGFAFASEINALRKTGDFQIDNDAIEIYLALGFVPFDRTVFTQIRKLLPAEWLRVRLDTFEVRSGRFFSHSDQYAPAIKDEAEAIEAVENALEKSVARRLESSDVEVGCFLSGGIDSSLVSFYASRRLDSLRTFTVRLGGSFDESPAAEQTARLLGTNHQTIDISPNLKDELEGILARFGEPFFDSSAVPSYYVAKAARQYVKVVLNGDGADELFAGYRRYAPIANGWILWAKKLKFLAGALPKPRKKMSAYNYIWRLFDIANAKSPLDFWAKSRSAIKLPLRSENRFAMELSRYFSELSELPELPDLSPLSLALISDQELLLFSDLLPKIDICSMAHSLEARSPFLSREMSMIAPSLDDSLKIRGMQTKYILRKLAAIRFGGIDNGGVTGGIHAAKIARAPKRGFEVPLAKWVEDDLSVMINDRLNSPNAFWLNFLDRSALDIPASREEKAKRIWAIYCLEVWHKNLSLDI